jgi:Iodothyronine deiodinase
MIELEQERMMAAWQSAANIAEGILLEQSTTEDERAANASACVLNLDLRIPTLLDGMDNATDLAYCAWPDRLYLVGSDGWIAYQGGPGPVNFDPREWEQAIATYLGGGPLPEKAAVTFSGSGDPERC